MWLEINPQGQFLFLQEATRRDLAAAFGDFLLDEGRVAQISAGHGDCHYPFGLAGVLLQWASSAASRFSG